MADFDTRSKLFIKERENSGADPDGIYIEGTLVHIKYDNKTQSAGYNFIRLYKSEIMQPISYNFVIKYFSEINDLVLTEPILIDKRAENDNVLLIYKNDINTLTMSVMANSYKNYTLKYGLNY